jgi:hypothetical protein
MRGMRDAQSGTLTGDTRYCENCLTAKDSTAPRETSSIITFKGKSGERYRFQAWVLGTRFKAVGGVYVVTRRSFEDRTFQSKASYQLLAIGQTNDLSVPFATRTEYGKLTEQGANCICVYAVADEKRRIEIEKDLVEGNEQWGGLLHYLFHAPVAQKAPGSS